EEPTIEDSIAILRRGAVIDRMAATEVPSTAELARRMVGRPVLLQVERPRVPCRQTVLQGLALCVLLIGAKSALAADNLLVVILSLVVGGVVGASGARRA
ncbi:MAG: DUF554 family protein, partial [Chloroflexia bacterium]|nr:DUF554 family protein [Chloroflexia bacterium]